VVDILTPGYKFLPHTTDAYIQSVGRTFAEALENAGLALFDTMCDLARIEQKVQDVITIDGADELELVYNWLEALLLKFELDKKVYSKFQVSVIKVPLSLKLTARAYGETFDRKKHGAKVEVKAVTYHRMEVVRKEHRVVIRFILDL
jgi:SHS2 domain-containing protein